MKSKKNKKMNESYFMIINLMNYYEHQMCVKTVEKIQSGTAFDSS